MGVRHVWLLLASWSWERAAACKPCTYSRGEGEIIPLLACTGTCSGVVSRFAILTLCDMKAGDVIFVTDLGYDVHQAFTDTEGYMTWTAATNLPAGSVISGYPGSAEWTSVPTGGAGAGLLDFAVAGDSMVIGWGSDPGANNPVITYAMTMAVDWLADHTPVSNANQCHNPGNTPVTNLKDSGGVNVKYKGITLGSADDILLAVQDKNNWEYSANGMNNQR
eukprot:Hpha_TRINITY_DN18622_c0_g1::TRINITY_DN18622_c0_g1_i1::g.115657::m.115657